MGAHNLVQLEHALSLGLRCVDCLNHMENENHVTPVPSISTTIYIDIYTTRSPYGDG